MWDYDSDSVKIRTLQSIEKDEELFIDYGDRQDRNIRTPWKFAEINVYPFKVALITI